jgi:hypothetical protein
MPCRFEGQIKQNLTNLKGELDQPQELSCDLSLLVEVGCSE